MAGRHSFGPRVPDPRRLILSLLAASAGSVVACQHGDARDENAAASPAEETRPQDLRRFTVAPDGLPFEAEAGIASDRYWGVRGAAGYRVEVPERWNGMLVMYAHGHRRGDPLALTVSNPTLRRHLLEQGYAWAASSYHANYYDVRAGVEDTNALALAFTAIAREHGRELPEPSKLYITGNSMGGHVAGAAVEAETLATARHRVRYHGALPMCGVMADTELASYFAAYALAVLELASLPPSSFPIADYNDRLPAVQRALFIDYPEQVTPQGEKLRAVLMNLSGGPRPGFAAGFGPWQARLLAVGAAEDDLSAPDLSGVLTRNVLDTTRIVYRFEDGSEPSADERAFNERILRLSADPEANRPRRDGLRWVPVLNGEFDVPVVMLQATGDLYVPFRMAQRYAERAAEHGSDAWLVQRAIRSVEHCDFSPEEESTAFDAMVDWEQHGNKPAGDEVRDAALLADPSYGCAFTRDEGASPTRATLPACE